MAIARPAVMRSLSPPSPPRCRFSTVVLLVNMPPKAEAIRVLVRVRPLGSKELEKGCSEAVATHTAEGAVVVNHASGPPNQFSFDAVYTNEHTQREIFSREVQPLCDSVLNGYNCTVFAYGQTGSGKTWTMMGPDDGIHDVDRRGVMPNSIQYIFDSVHRNTTPTVKYQVYVSYLELYMQDVTDLLFPKSGKLSVCIDKKSKGFIVKDLKQELVQNMEQAMKLFEAGTGNRHTASTNMNDRSSRSHSIFTVTVCCEDSTLNPTMPFKSVSKLNLVDLAGSERQTKTGAEGATLKEGCNINQSLSALGRVIDAIVKGEQPTFRVSPLTMLLKDSLGGESKTVMFANCSPANINVQETVGTLRFADRAKRIKNKPIKQRDPHQQRIEELMQRIDELEKQLAGQGIAFESDEELLAKIASLEAQLADVQAMYESEKIAADETSRLQQSVIDALTKELEAAQESGSGTSGALDSAKAEARAISERMSDLRGIVSRFVRELLSGDAINAVLLAGVKDETQRLLMEADATGASWSNEHVMALLDACRSEAAKGGGSRQAREDANKALRLVEEKASADVAQLKREAAFAEKQAAEELAAQTEKVEALQRENAELAAQAKDLTRKVERAVAKAEREITAAVTEREKAAARESEVKQALSTLQQQHERLKQASGGGGNTLEVLAQAAAAADEAAADLVKADAVYEDDVVKELRAALRLQVQLQQLEMLRSRALDTQLRQWRDHRAAAAAGGLAGMVNGQEAEALRAELDGARAEVKKLEEQQDKLLRGANKKLAAELQKVEAAMAKAASAQRDRDDLAASVEEITRMNVEFEASNDELRRKLQALAETHEREKKRSEAEVAHLKQQIDAAAEKERVAAAAAQEAKGLANEVSRLKDVEKQLQARVAGLSAKQQSQMDALKSEQTRVSNLQQKLEAKNAELEAKKVEWEAAMRAERATMTAMSTHQMQQLREAAQEQQDMEAERFQRTIQALEQEVQRMQMAAEEQLGDNDKLRDSLRELEEVLARKEESRIATHMEKEEAKRHRNLVMRAGDAAQRGMYQSRY